MGGRLLLHGKLAFVSFFFAPACFRLWEFGFLKETEQEEEEEGCGTIGKSLVANENVRRQIFFVPAHTIPFPSHFPAQFLLVGSTYSALRIITKSAKNLLGNVHFIPLHTVVRILMGLSHQCSKKEGVAKAFLLFPECRYTRKRCFVSLLARCTLHLTWEEEEGKCKMFVGGGRIGPG